MNIRIAVTASLSLLAVFLSTASLAADATGEQNSHQKSEPVKYISPDAQENNKAPDNTTKAEKTKKPEPTKKLEAIKEKWGVAEFNVRLTAVNSMLDIRYRVVDKKKAEPLFVRKDLPYIRHEKSGNTFGIPASPKIGFMRQAPKFIKDGRVYFFLVANPGRYIKKGDLITIIMGDMNAEHIIVQ